MVIKFDKVTFTYNNRILVNAFTWKINAAENWAITGKSGTGKTNILRALHGEYILSHGLVYLECRDERIVDLIGLRKYASFVFFEDQEINYSQFYYQQRYNSNEWEGTLTVKSFLENTGNQDVYQEIAGYFGVFQLLDREFIKLSNGEIRKVLIIKALTKMPRLLVLDDPCLGLDAGSRKMIDELITSIISTGIQVILVTKENTVPAGITHILHLGDNQFYKTYSPENRPQKAVPKKNDLLNRPFPVAVNKTNFSIAFRLHNVTVRYDNDVILESVNWTVSKGEKWALSGKNGAGKSMLISLLNADNPQAYSNDIKLFDKQRGHGESIWEIKAQIGFLSPEFHFCFDKHILSKEAILGGLYENPYIKPDTGYHFQPLFDFFIEYYQIGTILDRWFYELSTGQQRLVLFLRTLLKNPPLLLLDEPFQGFDMEMIEKSKLLLDKYCADRTLIFVSHNDYEFPGSINKFARIENGKLTAG